MRYLILLFVTFFLGGCFDDSSNPTATTTPTTSVVGGVNISGKVNLTNAGGIDASSITVSLGNLSVHPKDDGTYLLSGDVSKVAARSSGVLDTVKIIVAGDTLVEVPVESWSAILPTNYIVQRNVSCVIPKTFAGSSLQAVFWDNDSIAHVLNLGKGTTNYKFSGFIYTAYNDNQFKTNAKLYDIFARVKRNDSVVAYTEISEVSAKVGNVDFDSTQFNTTVNHIKYLYTLVPNDSSVKKYNDTISKKMVIDTVYDSTTIYGKNNSGWIVLQSTFDAWAADYYSNNITDSTIDVSAADSSFSKIEYMFFRDTIQYKNVTFESSDSSVTCSTFVVFSFTSSIDSNNVNFTLINWENDLAARTNKIVNFHVGQNYISVNNLNTLFYIGLGLDYSKITKFKAYVVYKKIIKHYI